MFALTYRYRSRLQGVFALLEAARRAWPSERRVLHPPLSDRLRRDIGLPPLEETPTNASRFGTGT